MKYALVDELCNYYILLYLKVRAQRWCTRDIIIECIDLSREQTLVKITIFVGNKIIVH